MGKITGTGCQLSALMTAFLVANKKDRSSGSGSSSLCDGTCRRDWLSSYMKWQDGNSTYRNRIIDAIYHMDQETLDQGANYEVR